MAVPITRPIPISQWDPHSYQALEPGARDGVYVSSDTCLLAAGPPMLSMLGGKAASTELLDSSFYPIGMAQGVSIGQNLQQMRIYELGSNFDYIVTGRSVGQVTMSKVFFSASSLLRVLYAYYKTNAVQTIEPLMSTPASAANILNDVYISPGSVNLFMNLQSDLFRNPIGLALLMRTTQNDDIAIFYMERAVVHAHNIAFDPNGIIVQENTTVSFSRVVPIDPQAIPAIGALTHYANFFDITTN